MWKQKPDKCYKIPNGGHRFLWKRNYSVNVMEFKMVEMRLLRKTQLTIKCFRIPMCGNEILWKPNEPTNFMEFHFGKETKYRFRRVLGYASEAPLSEKSEW